MVRRDVLVRERLRRGDTLPRVENEHLLKQIDRNGVLAREFLAKRHAFAFRQALYKTECLLA